jgi:hypothetical protein
MNTGQKFAALCAAFGIKLPEPKKTEAKSGRRHGWMGSWNPLSMDDHYVDDHGTLHRRDAKRDKSISARQWKIRKKALRREAKKAA